MRPRRLASIAMLALVALVALGSFAAAARAQGAVPPGVQPEVRADLLLGDRSAIQAGVGVQIPAGLYVRVGVDASAGFPTAAMDGARLGGRVDVLGRFVLDPFRQSRFGVSAGAGLSTRVEHGQRATPLLLVALDLEEHQRGASWVRAVQVGLGGGARLGVVLRRAEDAAR